MRLRFHVLPAAASIDAVWPPSSTQLQRSCGGDKQAAKRYPGCVGSPHAAQPRGLCARQPAATAARGLRGPTRRRGTSDADSYCRQPTFNNGREVPPSLSLCIACIKPCHKVRVAPTRPACRQRGTPLAGRAANARRRSFNMLPSAGTCQLKGTAGEECARCYPCSIEQLYGAAEMTAGRRGAPAG